MKGFYIGCVLAVLMLTACEQIAVLSTPHKTAMASKSIASEKAEQYFWDVLHQGRYNDIAKVEYRLMAAYLNNPNDPKLAAHIGFLNLWKIAEHQRLLGQDPRITNHIILAKHYFADAQALEPQNPIYQGFLGDAQLIEGQIFKDKREEVRGYFRLKHAISLWPEFNYFTAGYPMSTLPASSDHFKEALHWQWLTLDICAGKTINRQFPDYRRVMKQETTRGKKRACWNSWIAPYNFEGFFMNMGDMLVKSGDVATGILIYKNARLAKNYDSWPYKEALEKRIQLAEANATYFQKSSQTPEHSVMFNSGYGCMACHEAPRLRR